MQPPRHSEASIAPRTCLSLMDQISVFLVWMCSFEFKKLETCTPQEKLILLMSQVQWISLSRFKNVVIQSIFYLFSHLCLLQKKLLQMLTLLFKALLSLIYVFWMLCCAEAGLEAAQDDSVYIYLIQFYTFYREGRVSPKWPLAMCSSLGLKHGTQSLLHLLAGRVRVIEEDTHTHTYL